MMQFFAKVNLLAHICKLCLHKPLLQLMLLFIYFVIASPTWRPGIVVINVVAIIIKIIITLVMHIPVEKYLCFNSAAVVSK